MPSFISFLAVFSVIVFLGGSAFGALVLFIISIHRARRASFFQAGRQRRGAVSRGVLVTTRTGRKESGG
jgi:hypothetical protein